MDSPRRPSRRDRLRRVRLYLVVSPQAHGGGWETALARALDTGGIGMVQLRDKRPGDADFVRRATRVRRLTQASGALFILNDRVHLVEAVDADGAHVGEADLAPPLAREQLGEDRLLGLSTHDAMEVARAAARGADHVGLGPVHASTSKALARTPGGADLLRQALPAAGDLPVFPIGGIRPENAAALVAAGAKRLAVGAGVLEADDPAGAVRRLLALFGDTL
ncbi:MAG: thiamine phosphate synthase [Planctomycetota bacterium]